MQPAHGWDPRSCGAECDRCPLGPAGFLRRGMPPWTPVPDELHAGASTLAVAECPADEETAKGYPFAGKSGSEWVDSLAAVGKARAHVSIANVISCQPPGQPGGAYERMAKALKAENDRLEEAGETQRWAHPQECCKPRLLSVVARYRDVIALGGTAAKLLLSTEQGIFGIRGGPREIPTADPSITRRILPTFHPAFVLRATQWREVFQADLAKAFRWFEGRRNWSEPEVLIRPSVEQLRAWLADASPYGFETYDYETDGIEALTARVRCIGFGKLVHPYEAHCTFCQGTGRRITEPDGAGGFQVVLPEHRGLVCTFCAGKGRRVIDAKAIVVPILSVDGTSRFYSVEKEQALKQVITAYMIDPARLKVGHNCLYTGTPVILADGTSKAIEQLVRKQYDGNVLALRADGTVGPARVTGWFRERIPAQEWVVLRREGEKKHARGLTLTPDHEVYLLRGRRRVDQVQPGDYILTEEPVLDRDEAAAILGTLLGDTTAVAPTSAPSGVPGQPRKVAVRIVDAPKASLKGGHTSQGLVEEKQRWLGGKLHVGSEVVRGGYKPGGVFTTYRTERMRQVAQIAKLVYDETNRPRLRREALDALGPVGLAWLYADDGFKHKRDRKKEAMLIATCGFPKEDIEEGRAWFTERFGPTTITLNGSLRLSVAASQSFAEYIAPFLLPAARYKLPKGEWPEFVGWPARIHRPLPVRIESVERFDPARNTPRERLDAETRWCLQTTEGNFVTGFGIVKNCGAYDRMVSEQWLRVTPAPLLDTLFPARMRAPDLPKNLGVVGGVLTDVHVWKNDAEGNKLAYGAQSDGQLHWYNSLDAVVNARIVPPLMEAVDRVGGRRPLPECIRPKSWPASKPWTLLSVDHAAQDMCVGMHYLGAYIDQHRRVQHENKLAVDAVKWKSLAMRYAHAAGVTGKVHVSARTGETRRVDLFNPGSNDQLARVLFEEWGIVPKTFTEGGDPSVADEVIREILTSEGLPQERFDFLDAVRRFKRAVKARSTFIVPCRLRSEDPEHGLAWPDGRVRSSWAAHTTSVGRLSSQSNNQQNVPAKYRDMYAAAPGHVLIGGDVDQFHLRIIANRWGIARLQDAFSKGIDPHSSLAFDFFGRKFAEASGWGPSGFSLLTRDKPKKDSDADKMRQVAKVIRYRGAYWDTPEGIHQSVIKTEDGDGNLPFAHFSVREVKRLYKVWMRAEPEWEAAWQWCLDQYGRNGGWLETCILGRRSGSLENGKKEAVVNFDILPVETDIMRLIECEVLAAFPFYGEGPGTGMTNQCHDSIEIERVGQCWEEPAGRSHQGPDVYWRSAGKDRILCWTRKVEWDRAKLEECMNIRLTGWSIPITSETKAGRHWKEA